MKTQKKFDCILMKRKIQEKIFEKTRSLSPHQKLDYIRKQVENSSFLVSFKNIQILK